MKTRLRKPPRRALWVFLILVVVLALVAWLVWRRGTDTSTVRSRGDGKSFLLRLDAPIPQDTWTVSDFSFESTFYRTGFRADNVTLDGDRTRLSLDRRDTQHQPNSGAEVEKQGFYHYGRYEVVMQPASESGVVSSFFTHTFGLFGDPHDEIDIEFLGKNTRQISVNYFSDGKPYGPVSVDLGFDAGRAPQLYAFEWRPDRIDWYAKGERIHTATEADHPVPSTPSRVMMNLWTGSEAQYDWHGPPDFKDGVSAQYYCVSFQALGDDAPQCSDTFLASPGSD